MKPAAQTNDLSKVAAFSFTGLIISLIVTLESLATDTAWVLAYLD